MTRRSTKQRQASAYRIVADKAKRAGRHQDAERYRAKAHALVLENRREDEQREVKRAVEQTWLTTVSFQEDIEAAMLPTWVTLDEM